jgi:uncharacterized protein (UPF0548 family)
VLVRIARRGQLHRALSDYASEPFSYHEVGATQAELPAGYRHTRRATRLGAGKFAFDEASALLFGWEMHRRAGLMVASSGPVATGRTVVLGLGVGLVVVVPCRVAYVVNEPRRKGFAYGTLSGHPEQGEESFVVVRDDADVVWLHIDAFGRPGSTLTRVAGPIGRAVQAWVTRRYELALVSSGSAG